MEIERLKAAFTIGAAMRVIEADDLVDYTEIAFLSDIFPDTLLVRHGFIDAKGRFTKVFREQVQIAREMLPTLLTKEEKLTILAILRTACQVDGDVDDRELEIVQKAAELLNIPVEAVKPPPRKKPSRCGSKKAAPKPPPGVEHVETVPPPKKGGTRRK